MFLIETGFRYATLCFSFATAMQNPRSSASFPVSWHLNFLAFSSGSQDDVNENAPQRALAQVCTNPPDRQ
jgi:hypothetical protein